MAYDATRKMEIEIIVENSKSISIDCEISLCELDFASVL